MELIALPLELHHLVDANEDYWERGDSAVAPPPTRFANVGIYGWDVRDCLSYTAGVAAVRLSASPPHDDLLGAIPSNDSDLAARSVLGAFGPSAAQIDAARWFGKNGGIGTLIVAGRTTRCARWSTRTRSGPTPATTRWTERTATPSGGPPVSPSSTAASSTPSAPSTPTACCWRRCRT